jgi:hypothetical protein
MKYCKWCKIPAKEFDTDCPKCGKPVSVFGGQSSAGPPTVSGSTQSKPSVNRSVTDSDDSAPTGRMFHLQGEVQKLEETKTKNRKRGQTLGLVSLASVLAIVFILYQVYMSTVLSYAVLEDIKIEQDPMNDRRIRVSYNVKSPGQMAFDRRSGSRRTEKLDITTKTGPDGFSWAWPSDSKTGIDFHVVYRSGWFRDSTERHFTVAPSEREAD